MKDKSETTPPSGENVFEVDRIKALVKLMEEHDLSEIDLRESRHRIRICRGQQVVLAPQAMAGPAHHAPAAPAPSAPAAYGGSSAPAAESANVKIIKSPMVGTFYARPNPKSEPYVKPGDQIDANTVVCIIEAMKVYNEINAEIRGKIVAVLVQDGEAVDFEKPLFKVEVN